MAALGGLLAAYLCVCYAFADRFVSPLRNVAKSPPAGIVAKTILLDGRQVPCWTNAGFDPKKGTVFVFAHGYGGNRAHWAEAMKALAKDGYSSVAPAMPGQDASPEDRVGFGVSEAKLVRAAAGWARARGAKRVVGVGMSMGGASIWLASDSLDAVVTDAAYPTFDQACRRYFDRVVPNASLLLRPVVTIGAWKAGVDPSAIRPIDAARRFKGPALVIQGAEDKLFPTTFADELAKAARCEKWLVPGAGHPDCASMGEGYVGRLEKVARLADGEGSSQGIQP